MQQKLLEFCIWLEPKIRPLGWHCAATGSALYGHPDDPLRAVEDLDVLLFRHNGYEKQQTTWRPFDVLLNAGLRNIEDCTEYPEFEGAPFDKDHNPRKVFRVTVNGIKIDFLCIDELCLRR